MPYFSLRHYVRVKTNCFHEPKNRLKFFAVYEKKKPWFEIIASDFRQLDLCFPFVVFPNCTIFYVVPIT